MFPKLKKAEGNMPHNSLGEEIQVGGFYHLIGFYGNPIIRVDGVTPDTGRIGGFMVITERESEDDGIAEIIKCPMAAKIDPDRLGERISDEKIKDCILGLASDFFQRLNMFFGQHILQFAHFEPSSEFQELCRQIGECLSRKKT